MRATCVTVGVAALQHAAERRGERRAVRSPLVAASFIRLPPRLRTLCMSVARSASDRAERLRDGDRPARLAWLRCRSTVQFESLPVAHDLRDPLGGLAVPPLDDRARRRAPRQ